MCCCCWPFADAWLEDPVVEASKHANSKNVVYAPSRNAKPYKSSKKEKSKKKWVYVHPHSAKSVAPSKDEKPDCDWVYVPKSERKSDKVVSVAPSFFDSL